MRRLVIKVSMQVVDVDDGNTRCLSDVHEEESWASLKFIEDTEGKCISDMLLSLGAHCTRGIENEVAR